MIVSVISCHDFGLAHDRKVLSKSFFLTCAYDRAAMKNDQRVHHRQGGYDLLARAAPSEAKTIPINARHGSFHGVGDVSFTLSV